MGHPPNTASDRIPTLAEGLDRLRIEDFEAGRELLAQRVAADPHDADSWAYLSGALLATGRPLEAERAVEMALTANRAGFAPHLKAAELALRFGNVDIAEREAVLALRAASTESERGAARATLVLARGRLRQGVARRAELPRLHLPRLRPVRSRIAGRLRHFSVAQTTGRRRASLIEGDPS